MNRGLHDTHPLGDTFRPGIVVGGKFTLIRLIAQGGYGAVYEAEDNLIRRRVAVKLLHPQVAVMADVARGFIREAQALAKIEHPNVVAVYEMGQRRDGSYFIVQELLSGGNLRQLLEEKRCLHPRETVDILAPIMGALIAAHRRGIIHRDVKPDNIVLARTASGDIMPKLVDFGIAKMPRTGNWGKSTVLNPPLGTPHYMSPEQILQPASIDAPADVWAMGVVLFELIAGRCPFEDEPAKVLVRVQTEVVPRLESFVAAVPADIAAIVHDALDRDPERRPSMHVLRERLLAFGAGRDPKSITLTAPHSAPELVSLPIDDVEDPQLGSILGAAPALIDADAVAVGDVKIVEKADDEIVDVELEEVPLSSKDFIPAEEPKAQRSPTITWRGSGPPDMSWIDDRAPEGSPAALKAAMKAEEALQVNALDAAIVYAERAFAAAKGAGELAGRARLVQAIACSWLGGHADAERAAAEAAQIFPREGPAWYTAIGHVALAAGHLGKRRVLGQIAADLARIEATDRVPPAHMIAACRLVLSLIRVGSPDVAQEAFHGALRRAERLAAAEPFARAWLAVARAELAAHGGDPMMYLRQISASVDAFTEAGDVRSACLQRCNTGNAYLQIGGYAQAETVLREALTLAEPMGLGFVTSIRSNLAFALARLRHLDEAMSMATEALDQCVRLGHKRFECVTRIYLSLIHSLQGELDAAIRCAKESIDVSRDFPAIQAYAEATLAGHFLLQNQPSAALRVAQDATDLLDRLEGVEEGEALIRVVYASALHATGSRARALSKISEARSRLLARAARIFDPRWSRSFLENVPENARTMRLATHWAKGESDFLI